MELIRGLHNWRAGQQGCAVTIGNYDGVHLGHQAMIARLREHAKRLDVPSVVLTFEPTPREFLNPAAAPARLTRMREKLQLLANQGVDRCVVLRFNERLQKVQAHEFIEVLSDRLGARVVVVGHDFRFAYRGEATVDVLNAAAPEHGFEVEVVSPVQIGEERVSSTIVRAALKVGNLRRAAQLLGRRYSMSGRVIQGEHLGRKLGFATANIRLHRKVSPLRGVFAVRVRGGGLRDRQGVASIGTRPTVGDGLEWLLEVHVFDFAGDLYGQRLEVEFVAFIREERKFDSLEKMVTQIHEDAQKARGLLT